MLSLQADVKQFSLTFAVLCAVCAACLAGPEVLPSGKEMKQVAPAPSPCPNWSGFYAGISGGYKFADTDVNLDLIGGWNQSFDIIPQHTIEPKGSGDFLDTSGAELGGLIGYNFQWNNWVFGLEGAGNYLWLRESDTTGIFPVFFPRSGRNVDYSINTAFRTHYLATAGGRIGYTFCRLMPFVTGGVAFGDIDFEQEVIQHAGFQEGGSKSDTEVGWMVGAGLEYVLTEHWHLRTQYEYIDLSSESFRHHTTAAGFTGITRIELQEHNASFAIVYKF